MITNDWTYRDYAMLKKGTWYKSYSVCFTCSLPIHLCDKFNDRQRCQETDLILPICWAVKATERLEHYIEEFEGRIVDVDEYLSWLGRDRQVQDKRATNAVGLVDFMFEELYK
jgi:hypothetical protein